MIILIVVICSMFVWGGVDRGSRPGRITPKSINWYLIFLLVGSESECVRMERHFYTRASVAVS